jgi:adenosine/AMP kinase
MKCFSYNAGEDGLGIVLAKTKKQAGVLLKKDGMSAASICFEIDLSQEQVINIQE